MKVLEHRFEHISQEGHRGRALLAGLLPLFEGALATEAVQPEDLFLRYHHLGAIVLAVERVPAALVTRSRERVRSQALDHLVVGACADGPVRIEAGAWVGEASSGDLILLDLAQPLRITMLPQAGIAIVVPRRLLAGTTEDEEEHFSHKKVRKPARAPARHGRRDPRAETGSLHTCFGYGQ
ncbi:hypothetical protein ACUXK4_003373 [Methylorubrum extorquens]